MVRNRQYDLTPREEELMDMMWQANRPMSRAELRNMPVERSWKDNYLPVMLQALEKRGLIQVAGFVPSIRPHLVQGGAVCQVGSRASGKRPASPNAGSHGRDFGGGTRHGTTEQRHGSSGAGEQGQSQRETAGSPGRHLAGGRGGVTRDAHHTILFCNGSAVEQLADRSALLEPKVSQDDSDAEFWLSGLSLSVLFGTDIFLCGVAVYHCCECSDLYESSL